MLKRILLVCFSFLLVGCVRVDQLDDYSTLINDCLVDNVITNEVSLGYRYYVPRGVRKIYDYDYNQTFLVDGMPVYLYVDIVSYFHKKEVSFNKKSDYSVFKEIKQGDKVGYFALLDDNGLYFVRLYYNYSRIEFYSDEEHLNKMITLSSIILNSIHYNDTVIEKVLEGNFGEFSEMNYEVEKPTDASSDFSQYLEEYVQKEKKEQEEKLPDE